MGRFEFTEKHLGTPVRLILVNLDEARASGLARAAYEECARIESLYSRFLAGNALADLNARVGEWTEVNPEFYGFLEFGEDVKRRSEGAFDLSVKSILEGWGYDAGYSFLEGAAGQVGALELLDGRVRLSAPIELGGLGKGYAIDQVGKILRGGCGDFLIDAGGDLLLAGRDADGAAWRVAFEHPTDVSQAIGLFEGGDVALACSSPSRRSWAVGGATDAPGRRHHLVDPRSGEPAMGMLAVYTQAESAMVADAYSTALFVLGFERARELLAAGELPVEALLVGPDMKVFRTGGFKGELFAA